MTHLVSTERFGMLSIGMLSLICALTGGVFGFGADAPPDWTWGKGSFFFFLLLAAVAFVGSTIRRPSILWEVLDDIQGQRFQHPHQEQAHGLTDDQPDGGHYLQSIWRFDCLTELDHSLTRNDE